MLLLNPNGKCWKGIFSTAILVNAICFIVFKFLSLVYSRYSPFDIISGPVYAGKDRHYGEILAFYLSILLDMPRVPAVVSRKFDLKKEIIINADEQLLNTFLTNGHYKI